MKKGLLIGIIVILLIVGALFSGKKIIQSLFSGGSSSVTPTPSQVEQLTADKYPVVSLEFSSDGHYVVVNIDNLHADSLEYNLIYNATVKKNQIEAGVTGASKVDGKQTYSYKQLLGSESSGKFTYHESISNARMQLKLRNPDKYSIFSATYPFIVKPGQKVQLVAEQ